MRLQARNQPLVNHLIPFLASPVPAKDTTRRGAEPEQQRNECTECQPIRVAILGVDALVSVFVASDSKEHHIEDEGHKGNECSETRKERHDDGACTMVSRSAKSEEKRESCKASSWRAESMLNNYHEQFIWE